MPEIDQNKKSRYKKKTRYKKLFTADQNVSYIESRLYFDMVKIFDAQLSSILLFGIRSQDFEEETWAHLFAYAKQSILQSI